jgi:hypothetical protein
MYRAGTSTQALQSNVGMVQLPVRTENAGDLSRYVQSKISDLIVAAGIPCGSEVS